MTFGKRNEHVFLGRDFGHERDYSENVATIIDEEVTNIVNERYSKVKELLLKYRPHMNAIVKVLLEKETLDRAEVDAIMAEVDRLLAAGEDPTLPDNFTPPSSPTAEDPEAKIAIKTEEEEAPSGDDIKPEWKPKFA